MNKLLAKLPAFVLPFVTRSLRGGRAKRYMLFSLLLGLAPLVLGLWVGLGSGAFEQSVRTDLGLEDYEWNREREEFTVYVHDRHAQRYAELAVEGLRADGPYAPIDDRYGEVSTLAYNARGLIASATLGGATGPEHVALHERAKTLVARSPHDNVEYRQHVGRVDFSWDDPKQVAKLERVLDAGCIPQVRRYDSPLDLRDALGLVGFLAGLALAGCVTVFGPLLVAVQQAQERHENTLMPLTGTGLNPRQLALGLAAGPTSVVAIFAIPQLSLFGVGALFGGKPLFALALVAALAASGLFLTFAAQLLGHLVGQRRTPGIVGIALLSLLGIAWLSGAVLATELDNHLAGLAALLPTIGLTGILAATFLEIPARFDIEGVQLATGVWSAAALVFAWLALQALARKLEEREGPLLGAGAALIGAITCIVLVHVAVPWTVYDAHTLRLYFGFAALALPLAVLLMARVPVGDGPVGLRQIPVLKLLVEFASWQALHVVATVVLVWLNGDQMNDGLTDPLHPVALVWIGWCVGVLGLLAIRLVAVPASVSAHLWSGLCAASLLPGFAQAVYWGSQHSPHVEDVFALASISPVLGLLQVVMTIVIPISLVRHLRKNVGSVTGAQPSTPTETR